MKRLAGYRYRDSERRPIPWTLQAFGLAAAAAAYYFKLRDDHIAAALAQQAKTSQEQNCQLSSAMKAGFDALRAELQLLTTKFEARVDVANAHVDSVNHRIDSAYSAGKTVSANPRQSSGAHASCLRTTLQVQLLASLRHPS